MRKIPLYLLVILVLSCHSKNEGTTGSRQPSDTTVYYPYSPTYASAFEKGNPLYARRVLDVWKEFESGDVTHQIALFADTVSIIFPEALYRGRRDSALLFLKKRRGHYSEVQSFVDAWLPVRAKDTGDELVFVWGRQDCTAPDGKRDYRVIHEIWRFTGNGKIRSMEQYITHPY